MSEKMYLKPCAFCGEKSELAVIEMARIYEGSSRDNLCWEKVVECQNCGAQGGTADRSAEAVKSWNDRKNGQKVELIRVVNHGHDLTG